MALSGRILSDTYAGGYRLELDWTATQSTSNNTSTITTKLYWHSLGSGYPMYNSSRKSGSVSIDGSSSGFSGTGLAALNGNQRKLIDTTSRTVTHDDEGKKAMTISAYFDVNIQASSWIGRASLAKYVYLDTIARGSSLATDASWTAGGALNIGIRRASSSFTHEVEVRVETRDGVYDWVGLIDFSSSESSKTFNFSEAQNTEIFSHLDGRSEANTRLLLRTYSGGTRIGDTYYYGKVKAPAASYTKDFDAYVYVDESIPIQLDVENSSFTHAIEISLGSYTKTITTSSDSVTWTPSSSEQNSLYNQLKNTNSMQGNVRIITFYGGVQVQSPRNQFIVFYVRNSEPTFGTGYSYKDNFSTTTAITGNNQYIISGKSKVLVTLPSSARAQPKNGATMIQYVASLAGKERTASYSSSGTVTFDFGEIAANRDQTLAIKAVDSRGNSTTTTKPVNVMEYTLPEVAGASRRINGFDEATQIAMTIELSPLTVGSTNKNALTALGYRYKESKSNTWPSTYTNMNRTSSGNVYKTEMIIEYLDTTKAYDIEFYAEDKLGRTTIVRRVSSARPLFHMDDQLQSIGFNKFPNAEHEFKFNGKFVFDKDIWNDMSKGAGILFPTTSGGNDPDVLSDFDQFLVKNGMVSLNQGSGYFGIDQDVHLDNHALIFKAAGSSNIDHIHHDDGSNTYHFASDASYKDRGNATLAFKNLDMLEYKLANGYNMATMRSLSSHDSPMLLQSVIDTVPLANEYYAYKDFVFGVSFDGAAEWVSAVAVNAQSLNYNVGIYNIGSSTVRVYVKELSGAKFTRNIDVCVIAGGKKA